MKRRATRSKRRGTRRVKRGGANLPDSMKIFIVNPATGEELNAADMSTDELYEMLNEFEEWMTFHEAHKYDIHDRDEHIDEEANVSHDGRSPFFVASQFKPELIRYFLSQGEDPEYFADGSYTLRFEPIKAPSYPTSETPAAAAAAGRRRR
jgi:hypothetical protein